MGFGVRTGEPPDSGESAAADPLVSEQRPA
jgi:hypothetical protein